MHDESQITKFPMPMDPITRLGMVFSEELKRDKSGLLASLKDKYTERLSVAAHKRDKIFRSLFIIDAALAFLLSGQNFKFPVLDVSAIEIPAVVESITVASSLTLVFAVVQFITWASYDAISRQYGNVAAGVVPVVTNNHGKHNIDPDFINAAEAHTELTLKTLRFKFNIFGSDYYEPGKMFGIYSFLVGALIKLLIILFPVLHYTITYLSLFATYLTHGLGMETVIYFFIVIALNVLAVLVGIGAYKQFYFSMDFGKEPWTSR